MFRPIATAWTSSGRPMAAAYQIQFTRQRMTRRPRRANPGKPSAIETTTIADTSGEKARKLPNGTVDQAIRYERTKKITSSRRRTKARKPFVEVVAELPVTSAVWPLSLPAASPETGSFGSFCTMRVFMPAPQGSLRSTKFHVSRRSDMQPTGDPRGGFLVNWVAAL